MSVRVREWPHWWSFDLELTPHLLKRMVDRGFTELDLRRMLQRAETLEPDPLVGRWKISSRHEGQIWTVVVEPDTDTRQLVVVTAYKAE